jgi:hypothetical protein
MPKINNPDLYAKAKKMADATYSKPSAYKSGFIVKTYKDMGGTYSNDGNPKNLKRWYEEGWKSVSSPSMYPVLRPTKRINKNTPLLASEIKKSNLEKQIKLKQIYKGKRNLPKFEENI